MSGMTNMIVSMLLTGIEANLATIKAAKARQRARQPTGPRDTLCNFPGCDKLVKRNSLTGVCRDHCHMRGCRCQFCAKKKGDRHVPTEKD